MAAGTVVAPMKVLVPLTSYGNDPTEIAVPCMALIDAKDAQGRAQYDVVFATPDGMAARADERMLTGRDLPWLFQNTLKAKPEDVVRYNAVAQHPSFKAPLRYDAIKPAEYGALFLPGGHDKGMRAYLESQVLRDKIVAFAREQKPIGMICHGVLAAARAVDASAQPPRSILYDRQITGLTWSQEMLAYAMTCFKNGDYYRTYPTPMATEVKSYLRSAQQFHNGPGWPVPRHRDSAAHPEVGYCLVDEHVGRSTLVSARWPGDAHCFANAFLRILDQERQKAFAPQSLPK